MIPCYGHAETATCINARDATEWSLEQWHATLLGGDLYSETVRLGGRISANMESIQEKRILVELADLDTYHETVGLIPMESSTER